MYLSILNNREKQLFLGLAYDWQHLTESTANKNRL